MSSPNLNFKFSPHQLRRLKSVQFSVWGPEEIARGSVTQKIDQENISVDEGVYKINRQQGGMAEFGSLGDRRMGNLKRQNKCMTCGCGYEGGHVMDDCPGHFGHIKLNKPVFHSGYFKTILKVLRSVCFHCSALLLPDDKLAEIVKIRDRVTRNRRIAEESKSCHTCQQPTQKNAETGTASLRNGCGKRQPVYKAKTLRIEYDLKSEDEHGPEQTHVNLPAEEVMEIFKKISDEDCRTLGLDPKWARPEWMIISVLPVPPPHVRPSVEDSATSSEDDLTHQLTQILKLNNEIAKSRGQAMETEKMVESLQLSVAQYFDNARADGLVAADRNKRPLKTISQRLKGKEGRIRGNLMGKRVDFSARTVITADPNLSIDQVGVPRSVALVLTVPVIVTSFNINELRELVLRGPNEWPGAKYVIRKDHERIDLTYATLSEITLEPGWTVERHLQDDDIVLFNRQPSLHKMSIMGHRAKILDWSTFRLNLSVTTPYNADFDGDEMNLHVPQSIAAKADAQELMMVPRNIVTHQSNRNVMGIVQDTLLGVNRMTRRDVFIDRETFLTAMMWIATWDGNVPKPAIMKPKPLWTGKQLFSMICPKINYSGVNSRNKELEKAKYPASGKFAGAEVKDPFNFTDTQILIHDGYLLQGFVDKSIVGTSGGSIVHVCWLQKGWEETRNFMNQIQTTVNYWLVNTSYTVGVSDTVADPKTVLSIQTQLQDAKVKVKELMEKAQTGKMTHVPGKSIMESFEHNINTLLSSTRTSVGGSAVDSLKQRNGIKGTVVSGSKGNDMNISQIIACVGQQNIQGARIRYGFKHRTLPHFVKYDLGMASRGFIENSYLRGLTPQEFYFHAMCGREGCIDTAVKTSNTGYIQRRLVKAMESVTARYDGTLRNSRGCVIQFLYGEDGMDAQKIEKQAMENYALNENEFYKVYGIDLFSDEFGRTDWVNQYGEAASFLDSEVLEDIRFNQDLQFMLDEEYKQLLKDKESLVSIMNSRGAKKEADSRNFTDSTIYVPMNLNRIIYAAQREFNCNTLTPTKLHPRVILESVKKLCNEDLIVVQGNDMISREAQTNATLLSCIFIRSKLAVKRVLGEYGLSEEAFEHVLGCIKEAFVKAVVAPGEMAGVLAAQSIGEPATQMTLNTFHSTGIGSKNVTLGVPRLEELLNVAKTLRTPNMFIRLKQELDSDIAKSLFSRLEYVTLADLVDKSEIYYDPDPKNCVVVEDRYFVNDELNWDFDDEVKTEATSPWLLRLVLNEHKMDARYGAEKKILIKNEEVEFSMSDLKQKIENEFRNSGSAQSLVSVIHSKDNSRPEEIYAKGAKHRFVLHIRLVPSSENQEAADDMVDDGRKHWDILRTINKKLLSKDFQLYGIKGVKKVYVEEEKSGKWTLETDGSNMAELINCPHVQFQECICNDINEIFTVFGIEAARKSVFNELRDVLSFDNAYVNARHILVLADCMCWGGYIMPISRHGVNRSEVGPLLRASFEQSVEQFMEASSFAQADNFDGVTENILLGQMARIGTGIVDLLIDSKKLQEAYEMPKMNTSDYGDEYVSMETAITPSIVAPGGSASPYDYLRLSSPAGQLITSPSPAVMYEGAKSPYNPMSPGIGLGASTGARSPYISSAGYAMSRSPGYSPSSPSYSPSSPSYSPSSPSYSPSSPSYSPSSPSYSPSSPSYSPSSPSFSPSSPSYSPSSPSYSPSSPSYSPSSPSYSPTNTGNYNLSPNGGGHSPSSPSYSPTDLASSPANMPTYSPTGNNFSPDHKA